MQKRGRVLLGSLFLLMIAAALPAAALPIPVGTTPADDLIFNLNFTASTPPPPYDQVLIDSLFLEGTPFGQTLTIDYFGGLDGTDLFTSTSAQSTIIGAFFDFLGDPPPEFVDGIFSVGYRVDSGEKELTGLTALGVTAEFSSVQIRVVPAAAPEPGTLALLGVAISGLVLARRRAPHGQSIAV